MWIKIINGLPPSQEMLISENQVECIYKHPQTSEAYIIFNMGGVLVDRKLDNGFDDIASAMQSSPNYIELKLTQ